MTLLLVTGGARSGKSRYAEQLAEEYRREHPGKLLYLATMQAGDSEMEARIRDHRARRSDAWETIEEPCELEAILRGLDGHKVAAVLLDCITLWLTNLLLQPDAAGLEQWRNPAHAAAVIERAERLAELAARAPVPVIAVTNEVGDAIVPDSELGRVFRDLAGTANQKLARRAEDVWLTVCGIPLNLRELQHAPRRIDSRG